LQIIAMRSNRSYLPVVAALFVGALSLTNTGCLSCHPWGCKVANDVPFELNKATLPSYVIEPPDILLIDALRIAPLPPYKIEALDGLLIQATQVLPEEPISGVFTVAPEGTINLGPSYGSVAVAGLSTEAAREAIEKHLKTILKDPKVQVALAQSRAMQQLRGEHLVRPDGTVGLGVYGSVQVTGLTLEEAKAAIEDHLSQFLLRPEVSVDVFAYNSKFYYIVLDGAGYGQQVYRMSITGNETVLDAISSINGLPAVSSTRKIWVARPSTEAGHKERVMRVNWPDVVKCGEPSTNYQLFPGDRVYVKADSLITFDNLLAKVISPIERVLGVSLLGQQTILSFDRSLQRSGNGGGGGGF
jgi:polysaccharide export outer membrane protein